MLMDDIASLPEVAGLYKIIEPDNHGLSTARSYPWQLVFRLYSDSDQLPGDDHLATYKRHLLASRTLSFNTICYYTDVSFAIVRRYEYIETTVLEMET